MSDFRVEVSRSIEERATVVVKVTRTEVVHALGLEGEDRRNWREFVADFLIGDGEDRLKEAKPEGEIERDDEVVTWDVLGVIDD